MSFTQGIYHIATALDETQVLDLTAANPANGTPVISYAFNGGLNQTWSVRHLDDGTYIFINCASGGYLTVPSAPNNKDLYPTFCSVQDFSNDLQKWTIKDTGNGLYKFNSVGDSGFVLDLAEAKAVNFTPILAYPANSQTNQLWTFTTPK